MAGPNAICESSSRVRCGGAPEKAESRLEAGATKAKKQIPRFHFVTRQKPLDSQALLAPDNPNGPGQGSLVMTTGLAWRKGEIPRSPMEESPAKGAGDGDLGMTTMLFEPVEGEQRLESALGG